MCRMVPSLSPVKALFQHEPRERGRVALQLPAESRAEAHHGIVVLLVKKGFGVPT